MTPAAVDHDERRSRLTAVLLELVAEHGLEGASVRAVAAQAGVSLGTVQHYFPAKDDMLRHAYRQVGEDLGARADAEAARAPSAPAAIRAVLLELLPLDPRRTAAVRVSVAFAARALQVPDLLAELRRDLAELQDAVTAMFALAGAADPRREAAMAIAMVSGLSEPLLFGDGAFGPEDAVAALETHLARAFSGQPGAAGGRPAPLPS